MPRAAVVGGGLGGLSAAIHLRSGGWDVDLFEARRRTGGKAGVRSLGDFRFDSGPSLLTMPEVFRETFRAAGAALEDHLSLVPLNPITRYFFADGSTFDAPPGVPDFCRAAGGAFYDDERSFQAFFHRSKILERAAGTLFLREPIHEPSVLLRPANVSRLTTLVARGGLRPMHRTHRRYFRDSRVYQLFGRYATYNGSNPYVAPSTLDIIPYVETTGGGFAVKEGIRAIPEALDSLAREIGVCIHLESRVDEILLSGNRVTGVRVGDRTVDADVVVSNTDVYSTYDDLLRQDSRRYRRYRSQEPSSSGVVFFWAMDRVFPELTVNNIFFSSDYRREFDEIFREHAVPSSPTTYVNITSKVAPTDAPAGKENWFVLVNAPCDDGRDWEKEVGNLRTRVLALLDRTLGAELENSIGAESILTPRDIERETGSRGGSLYGISSNSPMAAFNRHPNRSREFPGLYFAGGSAHPGGGMPLALLSGKMAADLAMRRHTR